MCILSQVKRESLAKYMKEINFNTLSGEAWWKDQGSLCLNRLMLVLGSEHEIIIKASDVTGELAHLAALSISTAYFDNFCRMKTETERIQCDFDGSVRERCITIRRWLENWKLCWDTPGIQAPGAMVSQNAAKPSPECGKQHRGMGSYPDCWHEVLIIPALKVGTSCRLIPLTTWVKYMINSFLTWCLEAKEFYSQYQVGFCRHFAVDHAYLLKSDIQISFLNREHTLGVFFDLKKAYDTTWRYCYCGMLRYRI